MIKASSFIALFIISFGLRAEDQCKAIAVAVDQANCYQTQTSQLQQKIDAFRKQGVIAQDGLDQMNSRLFQDKILIKRLLVEKANKERNVLKYENVMETISSLISFEKKINDMSASWKKIKDSYIDILNAKITINSDLIALSQKVDATIKSMNVFSNNLSFYLNEYQNQLVSLNAGNTYEQIKSQINSLDSFFIEVKKATQSLKNIKDNIQGLNSQNSTDLFDINKLITPASIANSDLKTLGAQFELYQELIVQLNFCKSNNLISNCAELLKHEDTIANFPQAHLIPTLLSNLNSFKKYNDLDLKCKQIQSAIQAQNWSKAVNESDSLAQLISKVIND